MQRVELLVALEQALGGDLEESRLAEIYTVQELINAVLESAATGKTAPGLHSRFAGWEAVLRQEQSRDQEEEEAKSAPDPELLAVVRTRPFSEAFWFVVSRILQIASNDRFQLQVTGLEKLPPHGPFILCSNHQSFIDPIILGSVLPWRIFRDTFSVGTSEIFGKGFMRVLARWLRVVVVDPDANLIPAMRAGAFGLRHGRVLMLYPEGERSIDGTPKTFKKGAAILSLNLQVPIVPVAIEGFYQAWPRGKPFQKFAPLHIIFGDPIRPPADATPSEATYEKLTAELRARVVEMWEGLRKTNTDAEH
jgi:long-chain acyl-CoA synthetase